METRQAGRTPTRGERQIIADYLRGMAEDTHGLLHLADARLCGDVAAILRAHAGRLEAEATGVSAVQTAGLVGPLFAQI